MTMSTCLVRVEQDRRRGMSQMYGENQMQRFIVEKRDVENAVAKCLSGKGPSFRHATEFKIIGHQRDAD